MFTIYHGDTQLYRPGTAENNILSAYNPRLTLERNKAGSLSFTIPPQNQNFNQIEKLKSIISVFQDDEEIFRGRVMDDPTDTFLQKTVYVEGDLAYLNDSIQRPYEFEGAANALFSMLINKHNEQAEAEQRFEIGNITAVSASDITHVKVSEYSDTFSEITNRLINVYGGYVKTRRMQNVTYIDYLKDGDAGSAQTVAFGVNLVSLDTGGNSTDVFNVLIPLGATVKGEDGEMKPLGIESVNGGKDYIEDVQAIEKYGGRIVRTFTWSHIEDANELLLKAQNYLAFGIAENATLTIRAVDMHLLDGNIDKISLGDMVSINAQPHGITRAEICTRIDIDLINPENTVYTFGKPKTALTENVVQLIKKVGGGGGGMGTGLEEEILWLERWAEVYQDENEAIYEILTGQIDHITGRVSTAEILLNGVEANITLLTQEYNQIDKTILDLESLVEVNADNITLNSKAIDSMGNRVSNAEIRLDGVEGSVEILASKQVDIDEFEGRIAECESSIEVNADNITLNSQALDSMGNRVSSAEIRLDGVEGSVKILAEKQVSLDEYEGRLSECESSIEVNADNITLNSQALDSMGNRVSSAEIRLDGVEGSVKILAEKQVSLDEYEGRLSECESSIEVNADNITLNSHALDSMGNRVSNAEIRLDGVEGSVEILASKQVDIDEFEGRIAECESSIEVNADNITLNSQALDSMGNRVSNAEIRLDGVEAEIDLKVEKNGIISAINLTTEAATISASKINLQGYVTASELNATIADITLNNSLVIDTQLLTADTAEAATLKASSFTLANNAVKIGTLSMGTLVSEKVLSTSTSVDLAHSHKVTVSDDGTVTLGEVSATGGNFRIADTKAYKDGVSAALEGVTLEPSEWARNKLTVTASSGQTLDITPPALSNFIGQFEDDHAANVKIFSEASVFPVFDFDVDASSVYTEGVNSVTLSASGWVQNRNTVTASNGERETIYLPEFTISGGTDFDSNHTTKVYFITESLELPVKTAPVDASVVYEEGYADGWAAAKAKIRHDQTDKRLFYGPGSAVDTEEQIYKITVAAELDGPRNSAKGVVTAGAAARVYLDGTQILYANQTGTLNINAGML